MLHKMLERLANEYTFARAKPFSPSEFGDFVRKDLSEEARKQLIFIPYDLKVKASVGTGVWAAVPWLGFFDPLVTNSAKRGFYIVYLINPDSNSIYLSLNQGTTAVYNEFGESAGRSVLRRRAIDISQRVHEFAVKFDDSPITLGSETRLPLGYEAGHAFGRRYQAGAIDPEGFYSDFSMMLAAYECLIDRGGLTPADVMQESSPGSTVEETRRYYLSRRIERAPNVRPRVLERRGLICEGCFFNPTLHASYSGRPEHTPLDVHHMFPIHVLKEGESKRYKIPNDFYVLCPTCHRLIHQQEDVSDLDLLRSRIKFRLEKKEDNTSPVSFPAPSR